MTKSTRILRRAACLSLAALLAAPLLLGVHTARAAQPAQTDSSVTDLSAYSSPEVLVLYQDGGMEVLTYGSMDALASALDTLSNDSSVALVQPNYAYTSAALDTSDPLLEEQWALDNDGSFAMEEQSNPYPVYDDPFAQPTPPWQWHWPGWGRASSASGGGATAQAGIDINLETAWEAYDGGSRDVIVALVDTGIDYSHTDLSGRIWVNEDEIPGNGVDDDGNGYVDDVYGWNFYNNSAQVYTGSEDSHGTHGAGTIAASADNCVGIAGIVQSAHVQVMAVKALGGRDGTGTTADIIRAIQYAEANGAQICNLSLGTDQNDPALYQVMAQSDMLFVVAAGNDGSDIDQKPSYPASYDLDNVIAVANLSCDGALHASSNYGAQSVDLAAPGTYILSTTPGDSYSYMTGTSMSAPMVSAAAAMLYSSMEGATLADVKDVLLATAAPLDSLEGRTATGGMLDLGAAITYDGSLTGRDWERPAGQASGAPESNVQLLRWHGSAYLVIQVQDMDGDLYSAAYTTGAVEASWFQGGAAGHALELDRWGIALLPVTQGGRYTFYAADQAGHETVRMVSLSLANGTGG